MKKFTHSMLFAAALMLTAVADMATSTGSALMWYEPECPEELLK